jgi:uncharacterized protein with WD repeat
MFTGRRLKPEEIEAANTALSPDKKYKIGFYQESHREDRYEEVSDWAVIVWEVSSKKIVQSEGFRYNDDYQFNTTTGLNVYKVAFSDDGKFLLINGGSSEKTKIPFKPE